MRSSPVKVVHRLLMQHDTTLILGFSATAAIRSVRIPVEFELPGDEAIMHRDGERLVIERCGRDRLNSKTAARMKSSSLCPRTAARIGLAMIGRISTSIVDLDSHLQLTASLKPDWCPSQVLASDRQAGQMSRSVASSAKDVQSVPSQACKALPANAAREYARRGDAG